MKVALTGATGFFGASLVRALLEGGHEVIALRRATSSTKYIHNLPLEMRTADLLDLAALERAFHKAEAVIHAGSELVRKSPSKTVFQVSRDGTNNVIRACRKVGVRRLVHISTIGTIGPGKLDDPAQEGNPRPKWMNQIVYFRAKYEAELEARAGHSAGQDVVIVNPGVLMGPFDRNFTAGRLFKALKEGSLTYSVPGGACFVDVRDAAKGTVRALVNGRSGESYILGGENVSFPTGINRIVNVVGGKAPEKTLSPRVLLTGAKLMWFLGKSPVISADEMKLSARDLYYSSEKARKELGYEYSSFEAAVKAADDWYKQNGCYEKGTCRDSV